jgi:hypothetical protein
MGTPRLKRWCYISNTVHRIQNCLRRSPQKCGGSGSKPEDNQNDEVLPKYLIQAAEPLTICLQYSTSDGTAVARFRPFSSHDHLTRQGRLRTQLAAERTLCGGTCQFCHAACQCFHWEPAGRRTADLTSPIAQRYSAILENVGQG